HWTASLGKRVMVKTTEVMVGNSHRIDGQVASADDRTVRIAADDDGEVVVPYEAIKTARTVFEWGTGE
ncbi:MAG: hypothetical protein ACRDJ2_12640, partial [Actinomycetota bacterium]